MEECKSRCCVCQNCISPDGKRLPILAIPAFVLLSGCVHLERSARTQAVGPAAWTAAWGYAFSGARRRPLLCGKCRRIVVLLSVLVYVFLGGVTLHLCLR